MTTLFTPQDIFSLPNQGLMVTGKITGDEIKAGMSLKIQNDAGKNEIGKIIRVEQRKNSPIAGLLINGIAVETLQAKIGQPLEITI